MCVCLCVCMLACVHVHVSVCVFVFFPPLLGQGLERLYVVRQDYGLLCLESKYNFRRCL